MIKLVHKRALSLLLSAALLLTVAPITAFAATDIPYLDENGSRETADAAVIDSGTTTLASGWYVVNGDVTINQTVTVSGDVNLILADGASLTVAGSSNSAGIEVTSGNSLSIYAQSIASSMGRLTVTGSRNGAGIGGSGDDSSKDCGKITINGGIVTAASIKIPGIPGVGAGIGGGYGGITQSGSGGNGGEITINGGNVTATSGNGAGIGGGRGGSDPSGSGGYGGSGGNIKIEGGSVTATSAYGAGIGSGQNGSGGDVNIIGGSVNAASIQPAPTDGNNNPVFLSTVKLDGVSAATNVTSMTTTDISYGANGLYTDSSGKLYLWLPSGTAVTAAEANRTAYAGSVTAPSTGSVAGTLYEVPTITSVSVPESGSYKAGNALDFTVNFSKAVTVDTSGGMPYIPLTVGSDSTKKAVYTSGSGTSALTFRYTVAAGDSDTDGIALGSAIVLNNGAIKNTDADADLTLRGVGSTSGVLVDAAIPTISSAVPASGATGAPVNGLIAITFSEAMDSMSGTISLTKNGGSAEPLTAGSWSNGTTYIVPYNALAYNAAYTVKISGFQNTVGKAIPDYSYSFTTELKPSSPSVSPGTLTVTKGSTANFTISFGQGFSAATGAEILVDNSSVASVSMAQLTSPGSITVTGLAVGSTNLKVRFATITPLEITVPVTVQAAAPAESSGSKSNSGFDTLIPTPPTTFISDTTADFSVNGTYQFKITSTNGIVPSLVAGTSGIFKTQLVSTSGSDYYFRLTAIGKPGGKAGIYVNGTKLLAATVGAAASVVKSDTTLPFKVAKGKSYTFKLTADSKPFFVSGNASVFQTKFVKESGKDYIYQVTAIGKVGQAAGFYINSDKTPVAVATIA